MHFLKEETIAKATERCWWSNTAYIQDYKNHKHNDGKVIL